MGALQPRSAGGCWQGIACSIPQKQDMVSLRNTGYHLVVPELANIFSPDGPLARAIKEFRTRPFQIEMAEAVSRTIAENGVLVAEAGTGTGKTFAYLVPGLLSGGKVIVSTGTKTLQDQLFGRDIPLVREALNVPVTISASRTSELCVPLPPGTRTQGWPSADA